VATLKLGETICDAVQAKLESKIDARIATINTEKNDGIALASPRAYFRGQQQEIAPNSVPALFIMEAPGNFNEEGPHGLISEFDVLVYVLDSDQVGDRLAKRLQRWCRVVIEALWDDDPREQLNSSAYRIRPIRTIPGTVFEPTSLDAWRGFYVIVFRVTQEEA